MRPSLPPLASVLAGLPLVERTVVIGAWRLRMLAADDQSALLDATRSDPVLPIGLMLWESSLALARALATRDIDGRHVLELGAGAGLAGLAAARRGGRVVQTDVDRRALALARHNALLNGIETARQCRLDWSSLNPPPRADLIIGADILYDPADHAALARLLAAALAPHGTVLLADPNRLHSPAFIDRLAAAGWQVSRHPITEPDLTRPARAVAITLIEASRSAPAHGPE
jgi:predicted nicotinamide N-methyase